MHIYTHINETNIRAMSANVVSTAHSALLLATLSHQMRLQETKKSVPKQRGRMQHTNSNINLNIKANVLTAHAASSVHLLSTYG